MTTPPAEPAKPSQDSPVLCQQLANIIHDSLCLYCADGTSAGVDLSDAEVTAGKILDWLHDNADGITGITLARARHIARGYTPLHDDQHTAGELVTAAVYFAKGPSISAWPANWNTTPPPRGPNGQGGHPEIADLEEAGALLAAEIVRRRRVAQPDTE